jgi:serine/threonine protein phosphatase PrpC
MVPSVVPSVLEDACPIAPHGAPRGLAQAAHGITHIGRVRTANEDSLAVLPHLGLFLVADGMGGAAAGEVASRTVIERVTRAFGDPAGGRVAGARRLVEAVEDANRAIYEMASQDPEQAGMGSTFAGVLVLHHAAVIAHVGDSRIYRLRDRRLELLTQDHSLVNQYLQAGVLSLDRIGAFPGRNVITRAVGPCEEVDVETRKIAIEAGDVLLLCSDGLHGELEDAEIGAILRASRDPRDAAARLVERANEAGGSDNVTVVVVRWD